MKYNQLSREQRYTIYCLLQKKLSKSKIAEIIGVHRSTVTRELQRNTLKKSIVLVLLIIFPVTEENMGVELKF
jgi:IS30 family transposase